MLPENKLNKSLELAKTITRLTDTQFSFLGFKFGVDAILGLIPGIGDIIGAILGGYLLMVGYRLRVGKWRLFKMLVNLGVDTVLGAVPVLGDIFDAAYKANLRNLRIIEDHLKR